MIPKTKNKALSEKLELQQKTNPELLQPCYLEKLRKTGALNSKELEWTVFLKLKFKFKFNVYFQSSQ